MQKYDKNRSFFDSISCESLERGKSEHRMSRTQQRQLDVQTFGTACVESLRRGVRNRGRNRGNFRGGYRGSRYYEGRRDGGYEYYDSNRLYDTQLYENNYNRYSCNEYNRYDDYTHDCRRGDYDYNNYNYGRGYRTSRGDYNGRNYYEDDQSGQNIYNTEYISYNNRSYMT
eukprot:GHVL01004722.1.p2 GENE.GHVL01004722.1~~GHVL01004722.1.p2  ORF type:complete len:171 (+),score=35.75 GHVL01004722.1:788-1300(+)